MTELDDKIRPKAQEVIARFGIDVVFTPAAQGAGAYTPGSGKTTSAGVPVTVKGVCAAFEDALIDGDNVHAADLQVFIDDIQLQSLGYEPREADSAAVYGRNWQIIAIKKYPTGEFMGLWEIQLR